MYDSDRKYLSKFALDPDMEYGSEDLDGGDFSPYVSCDDDLDPEGPIMEEDFFLEK
ncbi:MAG: hypothetical protein PVJ44_13365 [Desulfobacterales bacterium]|jgi:hypothetical protein